MAEKQITGLGQSVAPLSRTTKDSEVFELLAVNATFDGSAAASAFLPAVEVVSDSGVVVARHVTGSTVAAGGSADVTFAPFLRNTTGPGSGSGVPPAGALDDYVFANANVTITGVGFNDQTNKLIQGNAVTLDGSTRVKVEFFCPGVELTGSPPNNQAIGFELWDGVTNKGTMGYVVGNRKTDGTKLLDAGGPVKLEIILTPAAGTHTYAIYGWKNVAGGTCAVFANTFVDGTGNFAPMWYRLTTT